MSISSDLARPVDGDVAMLVDTPPSQASALQREFGDRFSPDVIDQTLAVARHVLERSGSMATTAAIEELASESLRNRPTPRR